MILAVHESDLPTLTWRKNAEWMGGSGWKLMTKKLFSRKIWMIFRGPTEKANFFSLVVFLEAILCSGGVGERGGEVGDLEFDNLSITPILQGEKVKGERERKS